MVEMAVVGPAAFDVDIATEGGTALDRVVLAGAEDIVAKEDDAVVDDVVAGLDVPGGAVLHPARIAAETTVRKAMVQ